MRLEQLENQGARLLRPHYKVTVFTHLPAGGEAVPAGILRLDQVGVDMSDARFSYGTRYLDRSEAYPLDLPL